MTTSDGKSASSAEAPNERTAQGSPPRPWYSLRPVVKPLDASAHAATAKAGKNAASRPRAETEDDDGYDPYSDYHDGTAGFPSFEPDPWR